MQQQDWGNILEKDKFRTVESYHNIRGGKAHVDWKKVFFNKNARPLYSTFGFSSWVGYQQKTD